jgi:hypothetical protein
MHVAKNEKAKRQDDQEYDQYSYMRPTANGESEREREQKTSLPPFLSFLLRLFVAGYATNFKKYGVPLLLHESQLGQTVQTSRFWWTKNG